jgi:hypothetical protein
MLWEYVFEIPLPPKLKIFQNSTSEAFLNISKALRHITLQTAESTLEDNLCHGKMFLKSPYPPNSKFSKILL